MVEEQNSINISLKDGHKMGLCYAEYLYLVVKTIIVNTEHLLQTV